MKITKVISGIIAIGGLVGGLFFLSTNLTGSVISGLTQVATNIAGGSLFIAGIVGSYFYVRRNQNS